MNKNERVQLTILSNTMWLEIRDNMDNIQEYLDNSSHSLEKIASFLYSSLKLVLLELIIKEDIYEEYRPMNFSDEDFVDLVIEAFGESVPPLQDVDKNDLYNNGIRRIIWGHIKNKHNKLVSLSGKLNNKENSNKLETVDFNLLKECLTVVFVESLIRKREIQSLENSIL